MVVHIAGIDTPMWSEANLQESSHPVLHILESDKILELKTCRESLGKLVKQICYKDI